MLYVRRRRKFFEFWQQIKPLDAIWQARYIVICAAGENFSSLDNKLNLYMQFGKLAMSMCAAGENFSSFDRKIFNSRLKFNHFEKIPPYGG